MPKSRFSISLTELTNNVKTPKTWNWFSLEIGCSTNWNTEVLFKVIWKAKQKGFLIYSWLVFQISERQLLILAYILYNYTIHTWTEYNWQDFHIIVLPDMLDSFGNSAVIQWQMFQNHNKHIATNKLFKIMSILKV